MSKREDWLGIITARDEGEITTEDAIKTARNLRGAPMPTGGIQIELHAGGADIEIVIDRFGDVQSVYWSKP